MHRIAILMLMILAVPGTAFAGSPEMVRVIDLRHEARTSRDQNLVLVLEFSSDYCAYCRKLEKLFLLPMQRNPDYDSKVLIRSVSLDPRQELVDFEGNTVLGSEFAARYRVSLTPTLIFVDSNGTELSERLVGIWSEDYFGAFIDSRIDEARARL